MAALTIAGPSSGRVRLRLCASQPASRGGTKRSVQHTPAQIDRQTQTEPLSHFAFRTNRSSLLSCVLSFARCAAVRLLRGWAARTHSAVAQSL